MNYLYVRLVGSQLDDLLSGRWGKYYEDHDYYTNMRNDLKKGRGILYLPPEQWH